MIAFFNIVTKMIVVIYVCKIKSRFKIFFEIVNHFATANL